MYRKWDPEEKFLKREHTQIGYFFVIVRAVYFDVFCLVCFEILAAGMPTSLVTLIALLSLMPSESSKCSLKHQSVWRNNQEYTKVFTRCSIRHLGGSKKVANCIFTAFQLLSEDCSSCFGDSAQCGADHCKRKCLIPSNPSCHECIEKYNCRKSLFECTGVASVDLLPPFPLP